MAAIRVEHAAVLPRATSQVFRALVDPLRQIEWDVGTCLGVEPLTEGPAGKGSRNRVHLRGVGSPIELEIVDLEPGARIVHLERWPNGILRHTFTFVVVPEGTRLVQVGELVPSGVRGLLSPVLKGRFTRRFAQIAERLKRYLYAGGGQGD
jgi:uncharacterized protein YndB with AHSA1/START domain